MAREVKLILDLDTGRLRSDSRKAKRSVDQIDDSLDRTRQSTSALEGAWKKFGGVVGGLAVGELIRRGLTRAIQKGKQFEQQLADLSAITGITGDDLDQLGDEALNASIEFATAATDIVEAQKLVASQLAEKIDFNTQAGLQQLKDISNQATLLKTAAGIDLRTAVEATTGAVNQFGLEASEAGRVVNVLAAGAKFGAAEVGDQAEALKLAGTAAAGAGVDIETTQAAIQRLAAAGLRGQRAGTGLRNVFVRLQTRTEELADAGFGDVDIKANGFVDTLRQLKPLTDDTQARTKVFGEEAQQLAGILLEDVDALEDFSEQVRDTTTAQEQADRQLDTFDGALRQLTSTLDKELITAFQETNGVMVEFIHLTTSAIGYVADATEEINAWYEDISRLADTVGTFRAVVAAITDVVPALRLVKEALRWMGWDSAADQARDFVEQQERVTSEAKANAKQLASASQNFAANMDQLEKGTDAYKANADAIERNRQELLSARDYLQANAQWLRNKNSVLDEDSDAYRRNTIRLEENQSKLDAVREALKQVNAARTQDVETQDSEGDGGETELTRTQKLTQQIGKLKTARDKLLAQRGDLTVAQNAQITKLNEQIKKQQRLLDIESRRGQQASEFIGQSDQEVEDVSIGGDSEERQKELAARNLEDAYVDVGNAAQEAGEKSAEASRKAIDLSISEAEAYQRVSQAAANSISTSIERGQAVEKVVGNAIKAIISEIIAIQIRNAVASLPFPANIAVATAAVAASKALISQLVPEFKQGGFTGAQEMQNGGQIRGGRRLISVNEDGRSEFVVNADSTNAAPQTIQRINESPDFARSLEQRFSGESVPETGVGINPQFVGAEGIAEAVRQGLAEARITAPVSLSTLDDSLGDFRDTESIIGNETTL